MTDRWQAYESFLAMLDAIGRARIGDPHDAPPTER
jgi:hypothetical protein